MKLSIETDSYNARRYGKPYIGALSPVDGRVVRWGAWIGTPGQAGILEIEIEPGQPVIVGQKDTRGSSTGRYGVIRADGAIEYVAGKAAAVLAAREATTAQSAPTLADLLAALGVSNTTDALARIRALTEKN